MTTGQLLALSALGIAGAAVAFRPKKKKRKKNGTGRVRKYKTLGGLLEGIKKTKGCVVMVMMRPTATAAWRAAAERLAKEYPTVTFVSTADALAGKKFDADAPPVVDWFIGTSTGGLVVEDIYSTTGTDLDLLGLEMENAALSCPGVS